MSVSGLSPKVNYIQHSQRSEVQKESTPSLSSDSKLDLLIKNSKDYVAESFSESDTSAQVIQLLIEWMILKLLINKL